MTVIYDCLACRASPSFWAEGRHACVRQPGAQGRYVPRAWERVTRAAGELHDQQVTALDVYELELHHVIRGQVIALL
jgi:hypothetical protein